MSRAHRPGRTFYSFPDPDPAILEWRSVWRDFLRSPLTGATSADEAPNRWWSTDLGTMPPVTFESLRRGYERMTQMEERPSMPGYMPGCPCDHCNAARRSEWLLDARLRAWGPPPVVWPDDSAVEFDRLRRGYELAVARGEVFVVSANDDDPAIDPSLANRDDHDDHVKTLVDLAKQDNRKDFEDLAGMLGVDEAKRVELWEGTRRRVAKECRSRD